MAVHDASASCVWRGAGDGRSDVAAVCWAGARVLCSARKGESAVRLTEVKGEGEGESEGRLLRGHGKAVTALCCDESGSEVYAASMDGTLRAFDVKTGVCLGTHFGHQQQVNQMVWIAKDRVLTCSEGSRIRNKKKKERIFSSKLVFTDKTVHLWKLDEDQQVLKCFLALCFFC
jgi:WD40 repeat protein